MICPKCETEFYEKHAKFCTECGTPLVRNRKVDNISTNYIRNSSKLDMLIDQNNKIIELLEDLKQSSQ